MKVAILSTDDRDLLKKYDVEAPIFGTAPSALLQGFAGLPDVEVHVLSCIRKPMTSPEKIAPNIFFHPLLVPKMGWMTTGYQGCIRAVRRKLRELRPDIVHGQGTERDNAICAVMSGHPSVITIHGNMQLLAKLNHAAPFSFNWLSARLERFTVPRARGVVCITHYTEEAMKGLARKTWVAPNAVDRTFFDVAREENPETVLLCVGHVCYRKNQIGLMKALGGLAAQKKFKLVFVGSKSADAYSEEFLAAVNSRPWCEYRGSASRDELKRHLAQAKMLILASLEDNCPMVVLEAMAAGTPVVAPRVGGVPDLVEDGKNGLLCDPLVPSSIAGCVDRLLEDPALARELSSSAKLIAMERFHPVKIAQRHLGIYREALQMDS